RRRVVTELRREAVWVVEPEPAADAHRADDVPDAAGILPEGAEPPERLPLVVGGRAGRRAGGPAGRRIGRCLGRGRARGEGGGEADEARERRSTPPARAHARTGAAAR